MQPPTSQASSGARFGVVLAAAVLLAGLVAIIVTSSGSSSRRRRGGARPRHCLTAWNSDSEALAFGRHDSISHGYTDVQVGYMPKRARPACRASPRGVTAPSSSPRINSIQRPSTSARSTSRGNGCP